MKKYLLLILVCLIAFVACDNEEEELQSLPLVAITNDAIIGKWKHIESKISTGGSEAEWRPQTEDRIIEFFDDGTFKQHYNNCDTGTYQILLHPNNDDIKMIELSYDCEVDQNIYPENKSYWGIELLNDNHLIYFPTYKAPICIEGCSYKFRKL